MNFKFLKQNEMLIKSFKRFCFFFELFEHNIKWLKHEINTNIQYYKLVLIANLIKQWDSELFPRGSDAHPFAAIQAVNLIDFLLSEIDVIEIEIKF